MMRVVFEASNQSSEQAKESITQCLGVLKDLAFGVLNGNTSSIRNSDQVMEIKLTDGHKEAC